MELSSGDDESDVNDGPVIPASDEAIRLRAEVDFLREQLTRERARSQAASSKSPVDLRVSGKHASSVSSSSKRKLDKEDSRKTSRHRKTTRRDIACLGCVKSALKGRSAGDCWNHSGKGERCLRCDDGHVCLDTPSSIHAPARRLTELLLKDKKSKVCDY